MGLAGCEDRRVAAGLLALAGLAHLGVAWSLRHRPRYIAVPVGPAVLLAVAWWLYGQGLQTALGRTGG